METTTSVLDSIGGVFERFELCTIRELLKIVVLAIGFILGTVDLVTDWINWKQWNSVSGGSKILPIHTFQTVFLCVAVVGTILWTIEVCLMIHSSREHILRYKKKFKTTGKECAKKTQKSSSSKSKLSFTVRLLVGLFEDLPVVFFTVLLKSRTILWNSNTTRTFSSNDSYCCILGV